MDTEKTSAKTVYTRDLASKATKYIVENKDELGIETVLDYGTGRGRNAKYLHENGCFVYPYDINIHPNPLIPKIWNYIPTAHYDLVLCSFVLNTVTEEVRDRIIHKLSQLDTDRIIIEVRSKVDIITQSTKSKWKKHEDGWITRKGTFQKGFERSELMKLEIPNFRYHRTYTSNSSLFAIYTR